MISCILVQRSCPRQTLGKHSNWERLMLRLTTDTEGGSCGGILGMNVTIVNIPVRL